MRLAAIALLPLITTPGHAQTQEDVVAYIYVGCTIEKYCRVGDVTTLDNEILNLKTALVGATRVTCQVLGVGDDMEEDIAMAAEVAKAISEEGEQTCLSGVD